MSEENAQERLSGQLRDRTRLWTWCTAAVPLPAQAASVRASEPQARPGLWCDDRAGAGTCWQLPTLPPLQEKTLWPTEEPTQQVLGLICELVVSQFLIFSAFTSLSPVSLPPTPLQPRSSTDGISGTRDSFPQLAVRVCRRACEQRLSRAPGASSPPDELGWREIWRWAKSREDQGGPFPFLAF